MLRKVSVITGVLLFVAVSLPSLAFAAGNFGGSQNRNAANYRCKSGHTVRHAKACKENGGSR